jgi:adenosylhomocysteine nucleosidase
MGAGTLPAPQAARIIGVIAALSSEARCLGRSRQRADGSVRLDDGTLVRVSGIGPEAATLSAEALVRSGATALLSWGVAGGLDPALCSGTVLLASEVLASGGDAEHPSAMCFSTFLPWRERLQQRLGPSALQGALLSGPELIATPAHKAQLFARTAARAVDMESAAIAAVARRHELPFMAVRVIVDGARDALPAALADRLRQGGSWGPLLAMPQLWPSLLRLGVRYRRARSALRGCARVGITP